MDVNLREVSDSLMLDSIEYRLLPVFFRYFVPLTYRFWWHPLQSWTITCP